MDLGNQFERIAEPFPYDSGRDDGPVLLDAIVVRKSDQKVIKIEPNPLGSFGRGWPSET